MRRNSPGYSSVGAILSRSGSGPGPGKTRERISYCQDCLKVNVLSPLKDRIYLDENGKIDTKPPPPDSKSWRQCRKCGNIVGVYAAKQEADIVTLTQPRANPFNFSQINIHTGESRKFDRTCKTQAKKAIKTRPRAVQGRGY